MGGMIRGSHVEVGPSVASTTDLIADFEDDCQLQGMAPRSIVGYISHLRIFESLLNEWGVDLVQVDRNHVRELIRYLREVKKLHAKTIGNYLTGLSSFYNYLVYEGIVSVNPVLPVRKRYLTRYKKVDRTAERKLISVEEMAGFIKSIMDPRDKAVVMLLAKTGIRRNELIDIDEEDINWNGRSILLKPKPKRSNRQVYFDKETADVIRDWLDRRSRMDTTSKALFIGLRGERLNRSGITTLVTKWATYYGLHDPSSKQIEDHFTPHCCRHWITTHLRRAGMSREFIQELRGDARREAIDVYDHIDIGELRREYLDKIPKLTVFPIINDR